MLATAFFAASSKFEALWIGSPDSSKILLAASTLVPVIISGGLVKYRREE